jgi:hypothetical protein
VAPTRGDVDRPDSLPEPHRLNIARKFVVADVLGISKAELAKVVEAPTTKPSGIEDRAG